ncbi:MAG: FAD binding domain-containing protein [Hyphomicrobiales bacterium]|nr:FAD binding domain-containing protein [Hyphomicrobiales bacterium]MCP5372283.1 FAD binding domain-containing protein [Hyphomicrobiales bacterium]
MKPAPFDYARPDTVDEALDLLAEHGDGARILAGGQSLVAMLNMRLASPTVLVDISRLAPLRTIALDGGVLEVGAAVTQHELLTWPGLAAAQPLLALALPWVGHHQTRQRGTVCGSLAHADPSAELPLVLRHLDGSVVLRSRRGRRVLAAADFQTGMMTTALAADEMVVACRFPAAPAGGRVAFREVGQRHGDFAIVALAATARDGKVRLGVGGVAAVPATLDLPPLAGDALDDALNDFAWGLGAGDDIHATARYRRELVRRLGRRMVEEVARAHP